MKKAIKLILRFLLSPWRWFRKKRDGVLPSGKRHEVPNDILLGLVRDMIREGHTATIWVKGFSMRPFLEHMRDKVILAQPERPLQEGDAVLAEIGPGHYVLHRIIKIEGEKITLMGDGNLGSTETCRMKHVAGIVTHYIRPKRTIPATDERLIRRIKRWRRLLPCRRFLLLVYKSTI
ncbi:MAG: hypothetical protein MJZ60_06615 [Bacteroidaceae bacterium]|nr:hypothetical protein [Bacteroidaceae bacterium]